jgi:hypothetical protein
MFACLRDMSSHVGFHVILITLHGKYSVMQEVVYLVCYLGLLTHQRLAESARTLVFSDRLAIFIRPPQLTTFFLQ